MTFKHTHYDAIIVGARCAGASTAMLLAQAGAKVLLVDRATEIGDTLSTHVLARPAVTLLARWGILAKLIDAGTPVAKRSSFHYGQDVLNIDIKARGGVDGLVAPRRWLLDKLLCDAAVRAGAELCLGIAFLETKAGSDGRVTGAVFQDRSGGTTAVSADLVIGADGRMSQVAKAVGAESLAQENASSATLLAYVPGIKTEGFQWYFRKELAAGEIATTGGEHCIFVACQSAVFKKTFLPDPWARFCENIRLCDGQLAEELAAIGPQNRLRRFAGAAGFVRDCQGPGWALVGDAGYYKDPISAHGITDALIDANRLATQVLECGADLSKYQAIRDNHAFKMLKVSHDMATFQWDFDELQGLHSKVAAIVKAEQGEVESGNDAIQFAA